MELKNFLFLKKSYPNQYYCAEWKEVVGVASPDFFCLETIFIWNVFLQPTPLDKFNAKKSYSICSQVKWKSLQITVFLATRKLSNSFCHSIIHYIDEGYGIFGIFMYFC